MEKYEIGERPKTVLRTVPKAKSYNLDEVIEFVREHDLGCGIFNSRNTAGDEMTNIYQKDGVSIDACFYWDYLEVFGLTEGDFETLLDKV